MNVFDGIMQSFGAMGDIMGSDIQADSFQGGMGDVENALIETNQPLMSPAPPSQLMSNITAQFGAPGGQSGVTVMERDEMAAPPTIGNDVPAMTAPGGGGGAGDSVAGNMAKMAMMFSDRRLKRNIQSVGNLKGVNIYKYNYLWDDVERYGVMADEVPHAAVDTESGFQMVDYSRIF
jgi:hypothetical protein